MLSSISTLPLVLLPHVLSPRPRSPRQFATRVVVEVTGVGRDACLLKRSMRRSIKTSSEWRDTIVIWRLAVIDTRANGEVDNSTRPLALDEGSPDCV